MRHGNYHAGVLASDSLVANRLMTNGTVLAANDATQSLESGLQRAQFAAAFAGQPASVQRYSLEGTDDRRHKTPFRKLHGLLRVERVERE